MFLKKMSKIFLSGKFNPEGKNRVKKHIEYFIVKQLHNYFEFSFFEVETHKIVYRVIHE
jgi:hypothetical protein